MSEIEAGLIRNMAIKAKRAAEPLAATPSAVKNNVLLSVVDLLEKNKERIQRENSKDLEVARAKGLSSAMIDRLELTDDVIKSMITGLREVVALPDPVGEVFDMARRPNDMTVGRMRIPLGVIGMIYESRPNVTIDAAALCLKTGNAIILRGGSEAINSNIVLSEVLQEALAENNINADAVQVIPTIDREAINELLSQDDLIDLIIPRGGEGLIRFVAENSKVPVLKHYKGVCHIYVDKDADLAKATPIIINSKTQRPGVCNALEGLLVDKTVAESYLPEISNHLAKAGVELLGCGEAVRLSKSISLAKDDDWGTEFLDLKLCIKVVESFSEAKEYILEHGSQHTEVILTENYSTAQQFIREIDASGVFVNVSTRFNDGGQLGLGTEIGISTTKLHAYGPMGLRELTTSKFIVYGEGQVRE